VSKREVFTDRGSTAAAILNAHIEEAIIAYKEQLLSIESSYSWKQRRESRLRLRRAARRFFEHCGYRASSHLF
jgi:hypothetical protein